MKTLYLVRHAKSSWTFDLKDHDRPLGERGRKDVQRMAAFVKKIVPKPDLMITSTASRALYTALAMADAWEYPEESIHLTESLFHAGPSEISKVLSSCGDAHTVALFGHNPGFSDFYNETCKPFIDNISTCGVVGVQYDQSDWIRPENGKQLFFYTPKNLKV